MTETARFFDLVPYGEADQADVQKRFRANGIISEAGNKLVASSISSLFVRIADGEAMVEGFWYKNTASLDLAVAANTSGSTRVDRVVLRLNRTANTLVGAVLQGTPGAGAPALTQTSGGIYEFPLATLTIPTGTTSSITAGMITDARVYSPSVATSDDIQLGTAIPVSAQVQRRLLSVDPTTKLLYFAEPVASSRNFLHNSSMRVNQRNTAFTNVDGTFICDRWKFGYAAGSGTYLAQSLAANLGGSVPGSQGTPANVLLLQHQDNNAATATTLLSAYQVIEGTDVRDLSGLGMWLSFWTYALKAGTYGYTIEQSGSNVRYNGTFVVNNATTYEYKSFFIPWTALGSWVFTTAASMTLRFVAAAGATNQASVANAWNSDGKPAAPGISNSLTATNDLIYIIAPKLESGALPSPTLWAPPTLQSEEVECYRYLYVPAFTTMQSAMFALTVFHIMTTFAIPMRATPSLSVTPTPAFASTVPGAAQIAIIQASGYLTGLTYSSWVMASGTRFQAITQLSSSTNASSGAPGQVGILQVGTNVYPIFSAEL